MADSYQIIDGQVVPYHGGRKSHATDSWRDATPLELQLQEELQQAEQANDTLRAQLEAAEARARVFKDADESMQQAHHEALTRAEAAESECARWDSAIDAAFDAAAADLEQNLAEHDETHINGAYYGLCLMRMEIKKARTKEQQA